MSEQAPEAKARECAVCDVVWTVAALLAAVAVGAIAADALLNGRVSEWLGAKLSPVVATMFTRSEPEPAGAVDGSD